METDITAQSRAAHYWSYVSGHIMKYIFSAQCLLEKVDYSAITPANKSQFVHFILKVSSLFRRG